MSNYCCFRRGAQGQLSQCNVLRAVVKSHKGLINEQKYLRFRCFVRNYKNFSKFTWRNPCYEFCIVKLQPGIVYEKAKLKDTRQSTLSKRDALTGTLTQVPFCRKSYEHEFEHLCETVSEIMPKKEFVIQNLIMFSSIKSVLYYTKIMVITPGGAWWSVVN